MSLRPVDVSSARQVAETLINKIGVPGPTLDAFKKLLLGIDPFD